MGNVNEMSTSIWEKLKDILRVLNVLFGDLRKNFEFSWSRFKKIFKEILRDGKITSFFFVKFCSYIMVIVKFSFKSFKDT